MRSHQLQAGNLHELPFQRRGHVVGHRLRRCARIIYLHLDDGIIDRRQIAHRQAEISEHAEQNDRDRQRNRHHRTANEELGEIHAVLLGGFLCAASCGRRSIGVRHANLAAGSNQHLAGEHYPLVCGQSAR